MLNKFLFEFGLEIDMSSDKRSEHKINRLPCFEHKMT